MRTNHMKTRVEICKISSISVDNVQHNTVTDLQRIITSIPNVAVIKLGCTAMIHTASEGICKRIRDCDVNK
jgi:hypothetical protein